MAITSIPKAVKRFKIADYYGLISGSGETATVNYELMGTGFEKIDESPNAQVDRVQTVLSPFRTSNTLACLFCQNQLRPET